MGGSIAMCYVVLVDIDEKNLERGMNVIKKNHAPSVERKSRTQAKVDQLLANMTPSTTYDALAQVDIVIEAVFKYMALKKKISARLDEVCKPGCTPSSSTCRMSSVATSSLQPT